MAEQKTVAPSKTDEAKEAKKEAIKQLRELAKKMPENDKVRILIQTAIGKGERGGRSSGNSIADQVENFLKSAEGRVSGAKLYEAFGLGTREMKVQIRKLEEKNVKVIVTEEKGKLFYEVK